jgi:cytochrome c-type biogenesis protein CcmH
MLMKKFWFLPAVLFLAFLTAGSASAQTPTPEAVTDDQVNAVARELFCPECENIPLDACPSQACSDMRAEIREKLSQGWTKAQIKQYYVKRYGARVVGAPPAHGWNWLLYVIPPVAIFMLLGIGWVFYIAIRAWMAPNSEAVQSPPETQSLSEGVNEYVARLEAELKEAKK